MMNKTKICSKCGISKPIDEFYKHKDCKDRRYPECKECKREVNKKHYQDHQEEKISYSRNYYQDHQEERINYSRNYYEKTGREKAGKKSMYKDKTTPQYFGIVIGEQLIRHLFKDVIVMPPNNIGFDFICNKGKKIDVKTGCTQGIKYKHPKWNFHIRNNTTADFFICVAFDNRTDLNPLYMWLIPGYILNIQSGAQISQSTIHKWDKWKMDIDDAQMCCNEMKNHE